MRRAVFLILPATLGYPGAILEMNVSEMPAATASSDLCEEMQLDRKASNCRTDGQISIVTMYGDFSQLVDVFDGSQTARGLEFLGLGQRVDVQKAVYCLCKRTMDIVISLAALVSLFPVFLMAVVMIKWHDGGPVFFSQERVGKGGRTFRCFKFRSMMMDAQTMQEKLREKSQHSDPRTFKMSDDPRITPPGRIMRRFSIDELPQIMNVLAGDMSIVGPRPPLPSEVALYSDSDFRRLAVKPGLTCIWQVSGRSRLPFPEQVKLDVDYIQRRSLALDLTIILRTVPAVLSGDGAV